ncbi:MAG: hypothetical protein GY737_29505 [Desulfobacteraceae bacterium]|nr:hypothetical protein [Desulfobacteraceae bacterium]
MNGYSNEEDDSEEDDTYREWVAQSEGGQRFIPSVFARAAARADADAAASVGVEAERNTPPRRLDSHLQKELLGIINARIVDLSVSR